MDDLISRETVRETLQMYVPGFKWDTIDKIVDMMPSAQPELIEQGAYVRGFEQGKTQGMLDAKLEPTCNQLATDTISRQAAIDALDEIESEVADGYGYQYEKWRKYFCELPSAQPEPQWIPVSEKLPEERGFYLVKVCAEYRPIRIYAFSPWDMDKERKFWINDSDSHSHVFNHFVEAWMPLPEPYKGESED